MPAPNDNTTKAAANIARVELALRMRAQRHTYQEIGDALGVSLQRAAIIVKNGLRATIQEAADEVRQLEGAALDADYRKLQERADQGDPKAIDTRLRLRESYRKLYGLDAPTQTHLDLGGGPLAIIMDR